MQVNEIRILRTTRPVYDLKIEIFKIFTRYMKSACIISIHTVIKNLFPKSLVLRSAYTLWIRDTVCIKWNIPGIGRGIKTFLFYYRIIYLKHLMMILKQIVFSYVSSAPEG